MLTARAARVGQRTGETCLAGRPAHGNRFAAAGRASRTGGNAREVAFGGPIGLSLARKPDHSPLNRPPARRPYEKCGLRISYHRSLTGRQSDRVRKPPRP